MIISDDANNINSNDYEDDDILDTDIDIDTNIEPTLVFIRNESGKMKISVINTILGQSSLGSDCLSNMTKLLSTTNYQFKSVYLLHFPTTELATAAVTLLNGYQDETHHLFATTNIEPYEAELQLEKTYSVYLSERSNQTKRSTMKAIVKEALGKDHGLISFQKGEKFNNNRIIECYINTDTAGDSNADANNNVQNYNDIRTFKLEFSSKAKAENAVTILNGLEHQNIKLLASDSYEILSDTMTQLIIDEIKAARPVVKDDIHIDEGLEEEVRLSLLNDGASDPLSDTTDTENINERMNVKSVEAENEEDDYKTIIKDFVTEREFERKNDGYISNHSGMMTDSDTIQQQPTGRYVKQNRIILNNLPPEVDENYLRDMVCDLLGEVPLTAVHIPKNVNGISKGLGFIDFMDSDDCRRMKEEIPDVVLEGRVSSLEFSESGVPDDYDLSNFQRVKIRNITPSMDMSQLIDEKFENLIGYNIYTDPETDKATGKGHLDFLDIESAYVAAEAFHGLRVNGTLLQCKYGHVRFYSPYTHRNQVTTATPTTDADTDDSIAATTTATNEGNENKSSIEIDEELIKQQKESFLQERNSENDDDGDEPYVYKNYSKIDGQAVEDLDMSNKDEDTDDNNNGISSKEYSDDKDDDDDESEHEYNGFEEEEEEDEEKVIEEVSDRFGYISFHNLFDAEYAVQLLNNYRLYDHTLQAEVVTGTLDLTSNSTTTTFATATAAITTASGKHDFELTSDELDAINFNDDGDIDGINDDHNYIENNENDTDDEVDKVEKEPLRELLADTLISTKSKSDANTTDSILLIGNLPPTASALEILSYLEKKIGKCTVEDLKIAFDKSTGKSKGAAMIKFTSKEQADQATALFATEKFSGREIKMLSEEEVGQAFPYGIEGFEQKSYI